jgi:hypothetical protein
MAYSPEHEVLISVGFDITAYAWDVNSYLMQIRLIGHRCPLLDVKIVTHETERYARWVWMWIDLSPRRCPPIV